MRYLQCLKPHFKGLPIRLPFVFGPELAIDKAIPGPSCALPGPRDGQDARLVVGDEKVFVLEERAIDGLLPLAVAPAAKVATLHHELRHAVDGGAPVHIWGASHPTAGLLLL
jgi:hypothetical protein